MKIYLNDNEKYFLLLITFGIIAAFIYGYCKPYQKYTFEKQEAYASGTFQDIAYFANNTYSSPLLLMAADGSNKSTMEIFIPLGEDISIFGEKLYEAGNAYQNQIVLVDWSPDGKTLGVESSEDVGHLHYPALITEDGEILTCLDDPFFDRAYSMFFLQVLDDERIVVDVKGYLSQYNMKECREESVYYNGEVWDDFAISSKNWLAICEKIDGEVVIRVYDENRDVVSIPDAVWSFYFLTWSNDGNKLLYKIDYDKPVIHNFETGELIEIGKYIKRASFSPDGEKLIAHLAGDKLVIIDLSTMEETYISNGAYPSWRP